MTRYRSRREQTENNWLYLGIALIVAFLIAVAVLVYKQLSTPKTEFDSVTACRKIDGRPTADRQIVVLLDETDALTEHQKDFVKVRLTKLVQTELNQGELLSIYVLGPNHQRSKKPIFEMCKMRDGHDADALTENQKLLNRRFKQEFEGPLMAKIEGLMQDKGKSVDSQIFEMIRSIGVNAFDRWDVAGERQFLVFSDMLQNTKRYSMYRSDVDFGKFKKTNYYQQVRAYLPNAEVSIFYFINRPEFQKTRLQNFWQAYFADAGAVVNEVMPVGR